MNCSARIPERRQITPGTSTGRDSWLEGSSVYKKVLVGNDLNSILDCVSKRVASRSKDIIHDAVPILGHPRKGKTLIEEVMEMENLRELRQSSQEEKTEKDIAAASSYLQGGYGDDRGKVFSKLHNNRMRSKGHKLEMVQFWIQRKSLSPGVSQTLVLAVQKCFTLETLQTQLVPEQFDLPSCIILSASQISKE